MILYVYECRLLKTNAGFHMAGKTRNLNRRPVASSFLRRTTHVLVETDDGIEEIHRLSFLPSESRSYGSLTP